MESKKTWENQGKKKMVIKIGGGGGIGAVVLLGGALATAVLASAFVVRQKGRRSGKDRRRRHQNPPPEVHKQNEQDEPSDVYKHPSSGATTEVESDNDTAILVSTQSSTLDEKPRVEQINGGTTGDFYEVKACEQILCSISPKKLEKDAISDGSVIIEEGFPLMDEKLPFEPQNTMHANEVEMRLTKEDISDEISKEIEILEQVCIEEERVEREPNDDGEMEGMSRKEAIEITEIQPKQEENTEVCYDQEEIEVTVEDNAVEGVHIDLIEAQNDVNMKVNMEKQELEGFCSDDGEISEEEEAIESTKANLAAIGLKLSDDDNSPSEINVSESHSEVGLKALLPVFESPVIEHENVNGDEKEGALPIEIVKIIQEKDEAIEGSQEEQVNYIEEQLVKEQKECDRYDEGIVPEKCEEVEWTGEANQGHLPNDPIEVKEDENALVVHLAPENREFELPMLKEELVFPDDVVASKDDGANEEVAESLKVDGNKISMQVVNGQPKHDEDDAKRNITEEIKEELILPEDNEVTEGYGENEEFAESLELNEKPEDHEDGPEINIGKEVEEEDLISPENVGAVKEDLANEEVAESLEVNENKISMQFVNGQPKDEDEDDAKKEIKDEVISPEDIEVTERDDGNEESAESLELNLNTTLMQLAIGQPEDHEDDPEINVEMEVEEELISPENIGVVKEDIANEEVIDVERNIVEEVEDSSGTISTGIATEKDDLITEMSEDDENGEDNNIKDFHDETASSEEVEEISEGSGDSSMESNSEAVYPAELPQEFPTEPQQVKLLDQEVEGKIQEDRAVKKGEHDSKESQIIDEDSSLGPQKVKAEESNSQKISGNLEKTISNKYVVELKENPTNSKRRRMLIGTISVLSSLSCSWFFGLSSVELCLIVFLTMVLSSMATTRQDRGFEQRS